MKRTTRTLLTMCICLIAILLAGGGLFLQNDAARDVHFSVRFLPREQRDSGVTKQQSFGMQERLNDDGSFTDHITTDTYQNRYFGPLLIVCKSTKYES